MQADLAREIIAQALEDETYEGDIPDDDDKAVEVAEGLVVMAKDAWEQNIQGPEVEAILKLAERDENGSKESGKKKPAAKPAAKRPAKKEPEPEPDPEPEDEPEADSRASEEPWEGYDSDKVGEIIEGLEVWAEDEEFDSVQHILIYEEANKNRKKIVERATELLPEDMIPGEEVSGEVEPEPESDPEPEPPTATEPYEGYDDSKVSEIKEALTEYLDDEDTDDEDKLATLKQTFDYEALNKGRTGLMDFLDEKMDIYKEQDGDDEAGATEEEGEAEGAASSEDDSGDEEGSEGGEGDSEEAAPAAGKRSRRSSAAKDGADSDPEGDDAEHTELLKTVHELIARERLHVPPAIESEPVELPFDLTTVGDKELQKLFSAFTAYSYRAGYLLMLEEASEHKCKEAADEIVEAYVANNEADKDATVTKVKAEAEQHDEVKKWRKRQRRHGILAMSLRKDRDNYDRVCERLSRIETMRQDEWQRAGGGPTAKSRPGAK